VAEGFLISPNLSSHASAAFCGRTAEDFMDREYPADTCGAICPSFRPLGRFSLKGLSTHLEIKRGFFLLTLYPSFMINGEYHGD
jgi:hypothetical protein